MKSVLILIDIQKEYITQGRLFHLKGIEKSLSVCQSMLKFARENNWEIVHVQHTNGEGAARFDSKSDFFQFVSGFEPLKGEKHFIKKDFSCYSSAEFFDYMNSIAQTAEENKVFIMGYNSVMCCLSTLEEARRRKHKISFIEDASHAKAIGGMDEAETHMFMVNLYREKNLAKIVRAQSITSSLVISAALPALMSKTSGKLDASDSAAIINPQVEYKRT